MKPVGHSLPYKGGCPRHFNCRSVEIPWLRTWRELGIDLDETPPQAQWSRDDGLVSGDLTLEEWLRSKDESYVSGMLGKGRAKLFLEGKISASQLLDQSGNPMTLDELEQLVMSMPQPTAVVPGHVPQAPPPKKRVPRRQPRRSESVDLGEPPPTIPEFASDDDMRSWFNDQGIPTSVVADPDLAERLSRELYRLETTFPEIALPSLESPQYQYFGQVQDLTGRRLDQTLRLSAEDGWTSPWMTSSEHISTVEFGNLMFDQMDSFGVGSRAQVSRYMTRRWTKVYSEFIRTGTAPLGTSELALMSPRSLFADTFAACSMTPQSQWTSWMKEFASMLRQVVGQRDYAAYGSSYFGGI